MNESASTAAALGRPSASPWPRVVISDVARTSSGTTPSRGRAERYFAGGTVPWVKTLDLRNGEISATDECVTDLAVQETSLQVYPPGTVLVAMYGGFNQIGRTGLLRIPACVNQALSAIQVNRNRVVPEYLLAVLNFRVEYWKAVASSSRKDPNITGNDVRAFELPVPPIEEQRSIAAALSDVDTLLAKIDQLIAKKRDLKQVAMQQLLTGRTRLPGFSDPWREQAIGELAEIVSGATPRTGVREYWGGGIPWCTPTDITASTAKFLKETDRTLTAAGLAACSARLLPAGALLLCTRATVGEVKIAAMPVCTNQGFKSLVCRGDLHNEYLYYQLLTMKPRMLAKASGSTFPELSRAETAALQLPVPSLGEQRAIAQVLADIDDELVALEARCEKTRQLKQGMMQALLTGRIRLV